MIKERITDELLDSLAEKYLAIKAKLALHDVKYMTFEQFVEKELKERSCR